MILSTNESLDSLFKKLKAIKSGNLGSEFLALKITGNDEHRLAISYDNFPTVLIRINEEMHNNNKLHPIELEHLSVRYNVYCSIQEPDVSEPILGHFAVIKCISDGDEHLELLFLRVIEGFLGALCSNPSGKDVQNSIKKLLDIFLCLKSAPRKEVQGLWSELFFIARSENCVRLLNFWRDEISNLFDFSCENFNLEIKSKIGQERRHHVNHNQIISHNEKYNIFVSFLLKKSSDGTSIKDLMEIIKKRISDSHKLLIYKLEYVVNLTLGSSWKSIEIDRYDSLFAEEHLRVYQSKDIPIIQGNIDHRILSVKYLIDFSQIKHFQEIPEELNSFFVKFNSRSI